MPRTSSTAERSQQEILRELYTLGPVAAFPGKVAQLLSRVVPTDLQGTAEMNYRTNYFHATREPALDPREQARLDEIFFRHVDEHPLGEPKKVLAGVSVILSEKLGPRGHARSPIYQEFYKALSVRDELGMSLPLGGGQALCFYLWREGCRFERQHAECLETLRPHLLQAYRNSEVFSNACGGVTLLEDVGEAVTRGLALLDARGGVREWSARGRRIVEAYFPGERAGSNTLPEVLLRWVRMHLVPVGTGAGISREPFRLEGAPGRLTVRLCNRQSPNEFLLVFEEQPSAPSPAVLRSLGLTPRESVIATWVAQGKTNPEIATILGANVLTVKVHLLHIFEKLGVETRTAAALRIAECQQGLV